MYTRGKILLFLILGLCAGKGLCLEADQRRKTFEQGVDHILYQQEGPIRTGEKSHLSERMAFYRIPGLGLTLIDGGKVAWSSGYGLRVAGTRDRVTSGTIFQAGSVSKFVTAVLLLHYVDQGVFDLDQDVNRYLKSWSIPRTECMEGKTITLRLLLTHQSGLPGTNFGRIPDQPLPSLVQVLKGESPATNKSACPLTAPGKQWAYSNLGYAVIQLVLEDRFGKSLNELAREVIFKPLNMHDTTFDYPLPTAWRSREAMPHARDGSVRAPVQDTPARAQGGLMTTTADMARLVMEILQCGQGKSGGVLSREMVGTMMTPHARVPREVMGLDLEMGLGVFIMQYGGHTLFLHPGHSYPGSVFMVLAMPDLGQGVVMGLNGDQGDLLKNELLVTLAEVYQWPIADFVKKREPVQ